MRALDTLLPGETGACLATLRRDLPVLLKQFLHIGEFLSRVERLGGYGGASSHQFSVFDQPFIAAPAEGDSCHARENAQSHHRAQAGRHSCHDSARHESSGNAA